MTTTRYFNAAWPLRSQPKFTPASTAVSKAVCVRKSMTITHCLRRGLDSIYGSFLRLWNRSGNRKCIFITPAGQENLIGQLLNVGGMQRLAHSSFVLRVGIHPERMWSTSLHVQIPPKKERREHKQRCKSFITTEISQEIECWRAELKRKSLQWSFGRVLYLLTFGKCVSAIIHFETKLKTATILEKPRKSNRFQTFSLLWLDRLRPFLLFYSTIKNTSKMKNPYLLTTNNCCIVPEHKWEWLPI